MAEEEQVQINEVSDRMRHFEIAAAGSNLARLYCELTKDSYGQAQSTCRLHFDGDVRAQVMRAVIDAVTRHVLDGLPRGMCIVYRGHFASSFEYGGKRIS